jgi:hypothetical protein
MKHQTDESKNRNSVPSAVKSNPAESAKFELPMDLDDVLAVAIFDTILRGKRRRFGSRGAARKPK